ncbi:hypothetical protein LguiB_006536 [Lonicera macranthoides]
MGSSFPPLLRTFSTLKSCNFDQIYQLGDSISDTGNLILEPRGAATPFGSLLYGESFFRNATGRCSDGMLMIDYIAMVSSLPFLNPYKKVDADFRHGVNFAVAGATALPLDVLRDWSVRTSVTNGSLNIQLDWKSTYFNSLCRPDCAEKHRSSLFMVGEIGGNDINYALAQGKPIEEVRNMVPVIVRAIKDAVLELNNLTIYQNELLQLAIKELKQENPNTTILYGDYYNAFQWLYRNAQYFDSQDLIWIESLQKGCYGTGGDYNFDLAKFCGGPGVPVCDDPSQRLSWDGVHFTQAAYKVMASWLINDILPQLQCFQSSIYQLGDSISDTGNLILEPGGAATPFGSLPYGESFFRNATGRCSDGMLMIDYIAIASGLPFLNPYKKVDADFRHGVNFAVAGATALPVDVLANWNTRTSVTNSSLNIQLDWMSTYFNSLCHPDCAEKHRSSLFMVGEIGGNDINYALAQGKPIKEVWNMVPVIVGAIKDAVLKVIHNGAIRIIVPGNFPIGCLPVYLTLFQTNNSSAYDQHNCLKELNNLSIYQNELLQLAIKELKQENPNTMILYGNYYNAFQWVYRNAQYFGKFQP